MTLPHRHIIRKASLEVNAGAVDAFRFQQEAVTWAQDHLLRELDGIFASLPDNGTHVVLDRLDIQVDASDPSQWQAEILPKLKTELAAALARSMQEGSRGAGEEKLSPGISFFRKLAYYLEHGVLPWNLMAAGRADLSQQLEEWLAAEDSVSAAKEMAALWKIPAARNRFLKAFSPALISRLLTRLFRMPEPLAASWSRDASRIAALPAARLLRSSEVLSSSPSLPVPLLQEALFALSHDAQLFDHGLEEEIVHAYLGRVLIEVTLDAATWRTVSFESPAFRSSLDRILRLFPEARPHRGSPAGAAQEPTPWKPVPEEKSSEPVSSKTPYRRPAAAEDPATEGLYIPNAGLILLAPFMSMLFERVDLATPQELKDPATAISLLHFLATGQEGPAEFQVPLAKVLCGVPLEKAIALPMSLAPHMKGEAMQLLKSAISHWSTIQDTSPDGLREAFLQRPGKLTHRPQGDWLLQVEQKPYDMLLQQLPWSFQLIRQPWMDQVLRTEWVE